MLVRVNHFPLVILLLHLNAWIVTLVLFYEYYYLQYLSSFGVIFQSLLNATIYK